MKYLRHLFSRVLTDNTNSISLQLFRAFLAGGIGFLVDITILWLLSLTGLHYQLCGVISFSIGVSVNYMLSIRYVFHEVAPVGRVSEFSIYMALSLVGLLLTGWVLWLFTEIVGFHFMLSKVIAALTVFGVNFWVRKYFLYSGRVYKDTYEDERNKRSPSDIYLYKAVIVDMDGTLYHQGPVRMVVFLHLLWHYMIRPHQIRELFILVQYRKLREKRAFVTQGDFDKLQIDFLAKKYKVTAERVCAIIDFWMHESPLPIVKKYVHRELCHKLARYRESGGVVAIYSDLPVEKKARAIGMRADYLFYSGDGTLRGMKPDKADMQVILGKIGFVAEDVLFIGDRYSRDGLSAQSVGMDFLIIGHRGQN